MSIVESRRSREEVEEIVVITRLELYNRGVPCGPTAIRTKMDAQCVRPLPSTSTITRALTRRGLTHARTGLYDGETAGDTSVAP